MSNKRDNQEMAALGVLIPMTVGGLRGMLDMYPDDAQVCIRTAENAETLPALGTGWGDLVVETATDGGAAQKVCTIMGYMPADDLEWLTDFLNGDAFLDNDRDL